MGEVLSGCKLRAPVPTFALRWESQLTPVGTKRIPIDEILVYHCGMVVVGFDKGLKKKPEENEEKSEKMYFT